LLQEDLKDIALKNVDLARSFKEALILGEKLGLDYTAEQQDEKLKIDCWVGGGQLIYENAIRHPNAYELILTTVHTNIDVDFSSGKKVSYFPAKYRWDNAFAEDLPSKKSVDDESGLTYTVSFHKRR
jgi:dihydrofolate reductase